MKFVLLLCVMVAAVIAEEKYTDKYDNVDLDQILSNKRLLDAYYDCIMGEGKCTADGKELRDHMPDAIQNGCEKCTENQKKGAQKVIDHLIKHELPYWRALTAKYDPTGEWRKKYEARAKEAGIVIPADE